MIFTVNLKMSGSGNKASKVFVITGSTDGIGLHTAKKLAALGHTIILHGRNKTRLSTAVSSLLALPGVRKDSVKSVLADISSVDNVRQMAAEIHSLTPLIDCIINNAGVFMDSFVKSGDGHEMTFAVNVLSHYLLTNLLQDLLLASPQPRIVNTSSMSQVSKIPAHFQLDEASFSNHKAYCLSKTCNRMMNVGHAKRLPTVTCISLDPGTVNTKMLLQGWGEIGIELEDANDTFWAATDDRLGLDCSGNYYVGRRASAKHNFSEEQVDQLFSYLQSLVE